MDRVTIYVTALYWSVMTVTSIGYGDITPTTVPEYIAVVIMQLTGSTVSPSLENSPPTQTESCLEPLLRAARVLCPSPISPLRVLSLPLSTLGVGLRHRRHLPHGLLGT